MTPIVSIIMGSTSDLPVMEKAAQLLNDMHVPFEMNALSAHRTPEAVEEFAKNARSRGIKVIIAAAGMAAALNCSQYYAAGDRSTCKRVCARWCRRSLLYYPDASRNPGSYGCHQWSDECSYPCYSDACFE